EEPRPVQQRSPPTPSGAPAGAGFEARASSPCRVWVIRRRVLHEDVHDLGEVLVERYQLREREPVLVAAEPGALGVGGKSDRGDGPGSVSSHDLSGRRLPGLTLFTRVGTRCRPLADPWRLSGKPRPGPSLPKHMEMSMDLYLFDVEFLEGSHKR